MKSYLSLIPISAKVHRRQNRMTLLCIIFAVFMVTAVFSMAEMGIRMEQARLVSKHGELSEQEIDELKGHAAAVENFGNFFAQNCFAAASGVVLIQGTLSMYKEVTLSSIALASLPVMLITVIFTFVQVFLFDRKVKKVGVRHD